MTVTLVESYNSCWPDWFNEIKKYLGKAVDDACLRIEHVGSTSIPGMTAKPIIDIIIVIKLERWQKVKSLLEEIGYFHNGDQGIPQREVFIPGETGLRTSLPDHHLYVCPETSPELRKETAFRDYLKEHHTERVRLSDLKWQLAEKYKNDKYPYMDGKDAMVKEITTRALAWIETKKR